MNFYKRLLILFVYSVAIACNTAREDKPVFEEGDRVIVPQYARGFEIHYHGTSAHIVLFNLEKPGDTLATINLNRPITGPYACTSTTQLAFLKELDLLQNVNGVCYADMIADTAVKKLVEKGNITNLTTGEILDAELLIATNPEILFTYPFSDFQVPQSFKGSHIPISEYLESHPLGRAEWIRLFGCISGQQSLADSLFATIVNEYNNTKALVNSETIKTKPSVFTGSYDGQMWYAPPAKSFQAQLISDAGGTYALSHLEGKANVVMGDEEIIHELQNVDYWGELVFGPAFSCGSLQGNKEKYSGIKARINHHLFYCNTTEGEYFGAALIHPDILLKDMIGMLHPAAVANHEARFFKLCSR